MSLSKVFKDRGDFEPRQLLPRPHGHWQPASLSVEERNQTAQDHELSGEGRDDEALDSPDEEPAVPEAQQSESVDEPGPIAEAREVEFPPSVPEPEPSPIDIEAIEQEAFQRGIQEGLRRAESDFGHAAAAFNQACEQLNSIREIILKNSRAEIIELVMAITEKVIRHAIGIQDQTIRETVTEALNQAVRSSEFVIHLNPEDIKTISEQSRDLIAGVNGLENIVLKEDPKIDRGGCFIESENCTVDATIVGQLQIIGDRLKNE